MSVDEALSGLKKLAAGNREIREKLLATRSLKNPVSAFCALSTEYGFPIYEMDLITAGEDSYAAMRRSTNGGGENSPLLSGEDDYFELFMADLEHLA